MRDDNEIMYKLLDDEIFGLKKEIYKKEYEKLVIKTGMKNLSHVTYSLKKGINSYGDYEGILIYAPLLYLRGYINYAPRNDAYAVINYKKKTGRWVWDSMYSDSNSINIESVSGTNINIDKFEIKLPKKRGKINYSKVYLKDLNKIIKEMMM